MTPSENWPKAFLLQIHAEAIKHGFIFIEPISEADAESLKGRLYRIRRRSDKSTASFIPPEYHLVTAGKWQASEAGQGRLPIIYSALPDGTSLPNIVPAKPEEILGPQPMSIPQPSSTTQLPPALELEPADLKLNPGDISNYVAGMIAKAKEKSGE